MTRTTSVRLPDDLSAAVRASGLPLADLIRRGLGTLDGQHRAEPADDGQDPATAAIAPHHHPATTRRLDDLATRLGQLASAVDDLSTRLDAAETELELNDPGALETAQEAETAERIGHISISGHARLWAAHGATPIDCFTAAATWQMSRGGARDRLGHITARGLATMTPKGPGQRRDLYTMLPPEAEESTS